MHPLRMLRRLGSFLSLRRSDRRTRSFFAVDWRVFGSGMHCVSTSADLSRGGAFVVTADPKPPGTPVVIELRTPMGPIERHARVVWRDARGMGLRFMRALGA
jgi:hypothetical protein